ncbi:hypothetical protein [Serratia inhibens]|uniref:hypothetical protein n=1 Tax=Serratia inhibens TaxID=2338073 RepID=UPI00025E306B|nr:hypothetical protein [Serratia inhibens]ANS41575.1 hypothetical protein Q5A_005465 [Serratia inhibens PRI-2C]
MAINVSQWPTTGNRTLLDIKTLNPSKLFSEHKSRVVADGGVILNESSLLDEITFLVNNGMWQYVTYYAAAEWGIKYDTDGTSVIKLYGLGPTDFVAYNTGGTNKRPVTLDTSVTPPKLKIWVWDGGTLLRAEKLVTAQYSKNNPFLFCVMMDDTESSDTVGIAISASRTTHPNALAFITVERATGKTPPTDYGFRHVAAKVAPVSSAADRVEYIRTPYISNIRNAMLLDPQSGRMMSYENGTLVNTATSDTAKLVDSTFEPMQFNIGIPDNNVSAWNVGYKAHGGITRLRCLSYATPAHAELISKRS